MVRDFRMHQIFIHIIIDDHPHRVVFFCCVWLYRWHFVCHIKPVVPIEDTQPRDEETFSSFATSTVYIYDTQPRDEETHYTPHFLATTTAYIPLLSRLRVH